MRKITIFDTTLRDGEQSPGASLNNKEKVEIARQLEKLGVDVIEAGFPIASPGDFEGVTAVSEAIKGSVVCALARCVGGDIEAAGAAVKKAAKKRIHVFLATSKIHRKYKLRKAESEILRLAVEGVKLARKFCDDVEFSPEDASRTEPEFLAQVVQATISAGAATINIPDTVGYAVPDQFGGLIRYLRENVKNGAKAIISVHCHNDLGLAVANSLAAVKAGAGQIECTINGLGERAGNCSLEEVVMAIRTRKNYFNARTGIRTKEIYPTSRLVSALTGIEVQRNKAIVGRNAFAHEAGIHQDGVIKRKETYEIMRPEDVGLKKSELVIGKHSGRHGVREKIKQLGYKLENAGVEKIYTQVMELADKKKVIFDEDIEALIEEELAEVVQTYRLESVQVTSGSALVPTATVRLIDEKGNVLQDASCGDGPVDAIFKCISRLTHYSGKLLDYQIRAITVGTDAMGEASLEIASDGDSVRGRGASTDIVEASAKAYLNAINRLIQRKRRKKKARRKKGKEKGV